MAPNSAREVRKEVLRMLAPLKWFVLVLIDAETSPALPGGKCLHTPSLATLLKYSCTESIFLCILRLM